MYILITQEHFNIIDMDLYLINSISKHMFAGLSITQGHSDGDDDVQIHNLLTTKEHLLE